MVLRHHFENLLKVHKPGLKLRLICQHAAQEATAAESLFHCENFCYMLISCVNLCVCVVTECLCVRNRLK